MELSLAANDLRDITLLQETTRSELWLARLSYEPVVVKRSKHMVPGVSHADMLRKEFDRLQRFSHTKLISAKGISTWNDTPVLLREYFEGQPLDRFLAGKPLPEHQFLGLAVALTEAVQSIHEAGFLHTRLCPDHLLLSPDLADFRILGLGQVWRRESGAQFQSDPALLNSPYQAPEQHPRSGALVDERSDIYGLGALFYQMLTGQTPIDRQKVLSTAIPGGQQSLQRGCPGVAPVLVRILEKMLATDLGQRYQTLEAVAVDLRICDEMSARGAPLADFEIDHLSDVSRLFSQGEQYGREAPLQSLVTTLRQSVGQPMATVLVRGVSGIGKSSLVYAAQQSVADQYHFVQVKYDQYASNSPFEGVFAGLQQLLRQLLSESSEQVQRWGDAFRLALENDAGILVEAMPELALFIGQPPEVVALPAADAKVRLYRLLSRFVQTLASIDHPLCVFLDDCQWADTATLEWLEKTQHEQHSVVVILAFREDADNMTTMLGGFLERLQGRQTLQQDISLEPLSAQVIGNLLQQRLRLSSDAAEALAVAIVKKTHGNPFYMAEYLRQCQRHRVLWFDHADLIWKLDLQQQTDIPVSENVVQLLAKRLAFLSNETQQVLKTAACVGNHFGIDMLKCLLPDLAIERLLVSAQADGWLVRRATAAGEYAFPHDRIQQAAYSLLDKHALQQLHLSIAQCIADSDAAESRLLERVHHYNAALDQINDTRLLDQIGQLNLRATEVAKANGDFQLALEYVILAMKLLLSQQTDPQLRAEVFKERAECEHLCGQQSAALSYYQQALQASTDARQRTRIYELLIKFHTDYGEFQHAFEIGRKALSHLDFSVPAGFNPVNFAADYLHLKRKLRGSTTETLLALPEASDARIRDQILLLSAMQKAAYQIRPELCVALAAKQVRLCLRYGNTREAVVGYMVFGVIYLGGVRGHAEAGCEYGRLSLAMLERYNNQMQSAEVPFVYGYFAHSWLHPASDTERYWQRAFEQGLKVGDWFHAGCAAAGILQSQLMRGQPLEQVLQQCDHFQATMQRIGALEHDQVLVGIRQVLLNLRHPSPALPVFSHDGFDERAYLNKLSQFGSRHFAHLYFINKMWVLYFHGYYDDAAAVAVTSQRYMKDSQGMLHAAEHCFLHALILAQTLRPHKGLKKHLDRRWIRRYTRQLQRWAKQSPGNFLDRAQLLQGEQHRLVGRLGEAHSCYQEACKTAEFYGHLNLQMIGHQLSEQLYASQAQRLAAQCHQMEKRWLAKKWGAVSGLPQAASASVDMQAGQFDLESLAQAVEVMSQERRLPRLLETLMTILQENTLARRCVLLLQEDRQYLIQAESLLERAETRVMQNQPYDQAADLPHRVINYAMASHEPILLDDACHYAVFANDPYFARYQVLSVLCVPLMIQGQVKGIVYLENDSAAGVFTQDRFALLRYLGGQIAISIENALVYQKLEQKVGERTQDIERQKQELQNQYDTIRHLNQRLTDENDERKLAEQKLQNANQQLQTLATTDGLTGLSNRRHFNQVLQQQYLYCKRHELPFTLLICDLDEFKAYNDHYGHLAGDECLIAVAECFTTVVKRPGDLVARYGGEEFAVILSATDRASALHIAEKIHQAIEQRAIPHEVSSVTPRVTMSIGLSVGLEVDTEQLILRADKALYRAKSAGKNRTCVFTAND
ncbi:diguanylate cyclase [Halomonas arcis]|uniref:Diguanylate cyclase (GGDEF) domain-containing protein n=1 Tax=Vreelandella arcis TaxID=416873 RepID=A0A1H0AC25_9GAMM|nr:diguanylate cyclase (GGDEF) domain-containing protein [Halomonas arcis]